MANLKSSKKDIRRTQKRTAVNRSIRSRVATFLKSAKQASINAESFEVGIAKIVLFEKNGMSAAGKGAVSKKSVSRHVSKMVLHLKTRFQKIA